MKTGRKPLLPPSAAAASREMRDLADPARAELCMRYFRTGPGQYGEGDRFLGVAVPRVRALAREFKELDAAGLSRLLKSPWHEERQLALFVLTHHYTRSKSPQDRSRWFRFYVKNLEGVNSWDLVDATAPHIAGPELLAMPLKARDAWFARWGKSKRLWTRRVGVVSVSYLIRRGQMEEAFRRLEASVHEREDLMQKATGWMLREAGKKSPGLLRDFLSRHARTMPRTMLRYAIEKFDRPERLRWMAQAKL